jgi:hypothetical protein
VQDHSGPSQKAILRLRAIERDVISYPEVLGGNFKRDKEIADMRVRDSRILLDLLQAT